MIDASELPYPTEQRCRLLMLMNIQSPGFYTRLKRKARSPTQEGEDLQQKAGPMLS
jgi:hypothetical protein